MFALTMSLLVLIILSFVFLNLERDHETKIQSINLRLQDYNDRMNEVLEAEAGDGVPATPQQVDTYIKEHPMRNLRVTLIRPDGTVVYDSKLKDVSQVQNHKNRKEIRDALRHGRGYDISRASSTVGGRFFYSATYFSKRQIIIRSALPFEYNLSQSIIADKMFMIISFIALIGISLLLYRFVRSLSRNVTQLRLFARKADNNEPLDFDDLAGFPNDELGEISEHIIKLYIRLQKTKNEQNVLKRQLTQNAAHELKTPIASIEGYLETILTNKDMSEETRQRFLERCYAQSHRMSALVNDISTLNRMDDGITNIQFVDINVSEIVENIINETALALKDRHMTFDNQLPAGVIVNGNQSLVYSIFRNLTDNAIAYAGEGTTITLSCEPLEPPTSSSFSANKTPNPDVPTYRFRFSDNGVGVPPQHLPRLFERFYRVDKGRSRKMGGTGLGLAIVKNAVLAHDGDITVENNPTGGLCFTFTL